MPLNNDDKNRNIMFGITTGIAALIVAFLVFMTMPKSNAPADAVSVSADSADATVAPNTATGDVQIGSGNYELTDVNGRAVTQDSFPGKYKLVFFGFTNCPDECPAALQKISAALTNLGADANRVQPLFITVDPARDTAEQMRGYLTNFNPNILGLTGTPEQIKQASDVFRAYYSPAAATPAAMTHDDHAMPAEKMAGMAHDATTADHQMVDHSAYIYLLSPSNELVTVLEPTRAPDDMAQTIRAAFTPAPGLDTAATEPAAAPAATAPAVGDTAPLVAPVKKSTDKMSVTPGPVAGSNSMSTDVPEETPPVTTTKDTTSGVPATTIPGAAKPPAEVVEPHAPMPQGQPNAPLKP